MQTKKSYKPYIFSLLVIILVFVFAIIYTPITSYRLERANYEILDNGWYYMNGSEKVYLADLPQKLDTEQNEILEISIVLPSQFHDDENILLRTSLQDVVVLLDGDILYSDILSDYPTGTPYASLWHIIEIPEHSNDKTLTIQLRSPFSSMSGMVNDIYYGSVGDLNLYIIHTYGYRFIMGIVILIIGIIGVFVNQFLDLSKSTSRAYLGIFTIMMALWILSESRMLQFVIGNRFILGSLSYLMIPLLPIPIIFYIKDYLISKHEILYRFMIVYYIVQFVVVFMLQILGIAYFFTTVTTVQLSILVGAVILAVTLFLEFRETKKEEIKSFLLYFIIIGLFGLMEIVNFLFSDFDNTSLYGLIILTVFALYMIIRYILDVHSRIKRSYQLEVYEQLAYYDSLTGGKNRYAYEKDIDSAFYNNKIQDNLRLIIFDFDDFKNINDAFGHVEGDNALKRGFNAILEVFGPYGECYRIGGDEFSCIMYNIDENIYNQCILDLHKLSETIGNTKYKVVISIGSVVYTANTYEKPSDMLRQADKDMYYYKYKRKAKD